ncbi:MAG: DUF2069 domain-containing protein [Rubrivivax sp.]|nr:DUF2069 domain-containing protein [Rubrivivax sp.]
MPTSPAPTSSPSSLPSLPIARPSGPVATARWLALALAAALVVLGVAWESWLAPTGRGTLVLKMLPLALALPGLWRHRLYTYRWLSLLVWLYVLEGLMRATSEDGLAVALSSAEVVLAVALFSAVTFYIRRRLADGAAATGRA